MENSNKKINSTAEKLIRAYITSQQKCENALNAINKVMERIPTMNLDDKEKDKWMNSAMKVKELILEEYEKYKDGF